jgi:hypothetical protein
MDTLGETYTDLIKTYKEPLIWKFDYNKHNRISMYGDNDDPESTFIIFYKDNNKYFIDAGYCYEYGDYEHGRFYSFGYNHEIKQKIKLEDNAYLHLFNELKHSIDYTILNEDECVADSYNFITINNITIVYEIHEDINFANESEKTKFIETFAQTLL